MFFKSLFLAALTLLPTFAMAHPGHDVNALHLHVGTPSTASSLDLRLTFAALVLGLVYQAFRAFNRR